MNLTITDLAQERLNTLVGEQMREQDKAIRVFMQEGGCGCSGPRFGMGLDDAGTEDSVLEFGTLKFIVDPNSASQLEDAPNAAAGGACGCGGGAH